MINISETIANISSLTNKHAKNLWLLLLLSGVIGLIEGISSATWQHPVETAQVLMGLVTYDHSSLPYIYHVTLFSILNYIAWVFLAITNSEVSSSILLSALLGVIAMQSLAMIIFLILRNAYLATLIALCLGATNFFGPGISYPIIFMGTEHSYGRAGLSFALYAILWLAFSRYRTGLFLCGITLGMHPAWGAWINMCLVLVFVIQYKNLKFILAPKNILFYLAGICIPIAMLFWQRMNYPVTLELHPIDISAAKDIFINYIRYWDFHRQKFDNPVELLQGFLLAFVSIYFSVLYLYKNHNNRSKGEILFFSFVIVSALLAMPLVFIPSWFDPGIFPEFFVALMPGRFINIPIFIGTPILFAYLNLIKNKLISIPLQLMAMQVLFFVVNENKNVTSFVSLILAIILAIIWLSRSDRVQTLFKSNKYLIKISGLVLATIFMLYLTPPYLIYKYKFKALRTNFYQVNIPQTFKGAILTTWEHYLVQVETRVSSITPQMDGYIYTGNVLVIPELNRFTKDIFGIDLSVAPSDTMHLHASHIATADYINLWESRDCKEWERLSEKYHFDLILVPESMHLQLQKIDNDPKWNKFDPKCLYNG